MHYGLKCQKSITAIAFVLRGFNAKMKNLVRFRPIMIMMTEADDTERVHFPGKSSAISIQVSWNLSVPRIFLCQLCFRTPLSQMK